MRSTFTFAVTAALVLPAGPALAAPPSGSWCATGWERWDVSAEPHQMDDRVDEAGNGNGIVCARALGEGWSKKFGVPDTIYNFDDDVHPAS